MRTNFSCVVLYYKVPSPVNTRDPNATPKIGSPARNMTLNKVQTVDAKRDIHNPSMRPTFQVFGARHIHPPQSGHQTHIFTPLPLEPTGKHVSAADYLCLLEPYLLLVGRPP
jgi:hypothetical protein